MLGYFITLSITFSLISPLGIEKEIINVLELKRVVKLLTPLFRKKLIRVLILRRLLFVVLVKVLVSHCILYMDVMFLLEV